MAARHGARSSKETQEMFIAMNRFQVNRGREADFEAVWRGRNTQIAAVPGFVEFNLLRGPQTRRAHALCLAHRLGEPRRLRGVDEVRGLPPRPCRRRRRPRASMPAIRPSRASRRSPIRHDASQKRRPDHAQDRSGNRRSPPGFAKRRRLPPKAARSPSSSTTSSRRMPAAVPSSCSTTGSTRRSTR